MKWEYKIVFFTIEPLENEEEYEGRLHNGVHVLNDLGVQGWELVQFVDHPITKNAWKHHAVMKRPLA
jgi:hypothetical protein